MDEHVEGFTENQGWKDPGQVFEGLFNEISIFLFTVEAGICHYVLYQKKPN